MGISKQFFFWTIASALACCGCADPLDPPFFLADLEKQYAYFPLQIGKFVEYRVDSIVYDFGPGGSPTIDSSTTDVREFVSDTFRDASGDLLYIIERSERQTDTKPWEIRQIYSASRTDKAAVRTENNLRFLRLVFPFDERTRWNGNVWIDPYQEIEIAGERIRPFVNWDFRVTDFDFSAKVGPFVFDSLILVTEVDETNAIERRLSRAWYAKNIGLVKREQQILDSQYCNQIPAPTDCLTKIWEEKAQKGYILSQVILAHN